MLKSFQAAFHEEDIYIVASVEQVQDLNKTSLKILLADSKHMYEERILEEEELQEDQSKLRYSNSETQPTHQNHEYNIDTRNRGRGGRSYYRGRGRRRYYGPRDTSCIMFYRCDKLGHYATDFPNRLLRLQEAQENEGSETQDTNELMMHEVVYLNEKNCILDKYEANTDNEDICYLDNGASNHMTGDRRYFP